MRWILATLLVLMGFGFFQTAEFYPEAAWLQGPLIRTLYPVVTVVFALILVGASPWIKRRDPVLFSWTVLGLTGCLLVAPLLVAKDRQQEVDAAAQARAEETRRLLIADMRRRQQLFKATEADRRERMKTDRFAQYEGRIPLETLDALRRIDKEMQAELKRHTDDYTRALETHPTRGPSAWIRAQSTDDLDAELDAHTELYARTRAFTAFVETFEETYASQIEALGLEPPADRVAVAELERILQMWQQTHVYTLRQLDIALLGEAIKALNVLRDAWGTWNFDPRTSSLSFQNPDQEFAFHQAVARMQEISEEVTSLQ